MNRKEQRTFITQLVNNVKKQMLQKKLPAEWDGLELRWYIAEKFAGVVWGDWSKGQKRKYNNAMMVKNL